MITLIILVTIMGALGAWGISKYACQLGLVDIPNDRSSHQLPTPRGGGIGILLGFIFLSIYLSLSWFFWVPAAVLSVISFFDDRLGLSVRFRLLIQFVAAVVVLYYTPLFDSFYPVLIVFVVFIVGTTNFYNFMDGINGIAGMTGVVAFGLLAYSGWLESGLSDEVTIATGLAVACLGFLPFNIPSAKVFMGDVSSILLGFVFAVLVIKMSNNWVQFFVFSGFLFPFFADELVTMLERLISRQPLLKAHRQHLYQVLANEYAIPHWKVSLSYSVAQLIIGVVLLTLQPYGIVAILIALVIFIGFFTSINYRLKREIFSCSKYS